MVLPRPNNFASDTGETPPTCVEAFEANRAAVQRELTALVPHENLEKHIECHPDGNGGFYILFIVAGVLLGLLLLAAAASTGLFALVLASIVGSQFVTVSRDALGPPAPPPLPPPPLSITCFGDRLPGGVCSNLLPPRPSACCSSHTCGECRPFCLCDLPPSPPPPSGGCHPAGSLLELAGGEMVAIEDIKVGDRVATPSGPMPLTGFLHAEDIEGTYLHVSTATASMALSVLHQAFVNGTATYPSHIRVGDLLHTRRGLEPVTRVETGRARGAYHILVKGGTYFVDGILASDYHGDVSEATWPYVRWYVEARYRMGVPVIPIGRGLLRLSWPIRLLDDAGAPLHVKHALAPISIAFCILTELVNVASEHLPELLCTAAAALATLMATHMLLRARSRSNANDPRP